MQRIYAGETTEETVQWNIVENEGELVGLLHWSSFKPACIGSVGQNDNINTKSLSRKKKQTCGKGQDTSKTKQYMSVRMFDWGLHEFFLFLTYWHNLGLLEYQIHFYLFI